MKQCRILAFLAFFIVASFAQNITYSPKTIKLNKRGQNSLSVLSRNEVVVGYDYGKLQIVDIQTKTIKKQVFQFQHSVRSISTRDQSKIFAHDGNKVIMLDNNDKIVRTWPSRQVILDITIAQNATGFGYIALISKSIILEYSFSNITHASRYFTYFETGEDGADLAAYSPLHSQLYIVNGHNQKLMAVDIKTSTMFDPSLLNKTKPFNASSKNHTHDSNKSSKISRSSQNEEQKKQSFDENQRTNFQDSDSMRNNQPNPVKRSISRTIIFDRKFNFKIKQIIVDNKQLKLNNDALILITDEDVVYYTYKGSITTFLPYKKHDQDQFISLCFCQKKYLLILHRHLAEQKAIFYLTFFDKKTLITEKILQLNSIFKKFNEIKAFDCNSKLIVMLTDNEKLLILDNQYQQIQQPTFQIQFQQKELWQTYQNQWVLTFVLLLVFIWCCRRNNNQKILEETQSRNEKQQDGQVNEPQVEKLQDSKKNSEKSSQQKQTHSSKRQNKNVEEKEKGKKKKNKKKSN